MVRVAAVNRGEFPPINPDPCYVCPGCGGPKVPRAKRCSFCSGRGGGARKDPKTIKQGPCPACGGIKTRWSARFCVLCRGADQRLLFAPTSTRTCACGRRKDRKAKRCRRCRNEQEFGVVYDKFGRPKSLICPVCGGRKSRREYITCRACSGVQRRTPVCPTCRGPKNPAALQCRRCYKDPKKRKSPLRHSYPKTLKI